MEERISAILVKKNDFAKAVRIVNSMDVFYKAIDCRMIEPIVLDDQTLILCDEEGRLTQKEFNRAIYDENGKVVNQIVGDFLIVGNDRENGDFTSLSKEQIEKYTKLYHDPQKLEKIKGKNLFKAVPNQEVIDKIMATPKRIVCSF